ncbi:hypothetical protein CLV29_1904 [Naumannella halotolerans]|uniref:Uncharacterized protein n=1 Tax=Naumannella halotolerans TaxID=993414 RepID=A0A4R7JC30_9ACTN|nr:hypothetical protein CLV29_1904 [Naumannella halotolerans]
MWSRILRPARAAFAENDGPRRPNREIWPRSGRICQRAVTFPRFPRAQADEAIREPRAPSSPGTKAEIRLRTTSPLAMSHQRIRDWVRLIRISTPGPGGVVQDPATARSAFAENDGPRHPNRRIWPGSGRICCRAVTIRGTPIRSTCRARNVTPSDQGISASGPGPGVSCGSSGPAPAALSGERRPTPLKPPIWGTDADESAGEPSLSTMQPRR